MAGKYILLQMFESYFQSICIDLKLSSSLEAHRQATIKVKAIS